VLIIKEDFKNPVTPRILKISNTQDASSGEIFDFARLAGCSEMAMGSSTFSLSAFLINPHVKKLILPDYYYESLPVGPWPKNIEVEIFPLPEYIKPGQWKNTFFQRRKMLRYRPPS
jgi:hypothetical protein